MIASVLVGLFEPIDTPYPGPAEEDDEEDGEEEEESPEPLYFEREGYRTSEGQPTYECDSCKDDDGVEEVKLNDELRFYCGKCYGKHGGKQKNRVEMDNTFNINIGPQHPSTHGVLRLIGILQGETIL